MKGDKPMKKYFKVSFEYCEGVYCSNIAYAEKKEDVEAYYNKYAWRSVSDCAEWELNEAKAKGMPIITIDHIAEETITNTTEEKEDNTMTTTETTTAAIINAFNDALDRIISRPYANRSAWSRGVTIYAAELLDGLKEAVDGGWFDADDLRAPRLVARELLNGAGDWKQYSWGGSSLIYDRQIAERLCNKSELKQTRNGEREPNNREQWLDVQARALYQAAELVKSAIATAVKTI
jgi:hypothetical protein